MNCLFCFQDCHQIYSKYLLIYRCDECVIDFDIVLARIYINNIDDNIPEIYFNTIFKSWHIAVDKDKNKDLFNKFINYKEEISLQSLKKEIRNYLLLK